MGLGVVSNQTLELLDLEFGARGCEHFSKTCRKGTNDGERFGL